MATTIFIVQRVGPTGSEVSLTIQGLHDTPPPVADFVKRIAMLSTMHQEAIEILLQTCFNAQAQSFPPPFETSLRWASSYGQPAYKVCHMKFADGKYVSGSNMIST